MLESASCGNSKYITNKGCIIWLVCGLLLGAWIVFMMKFCMDWQEEEKEKYKLEKKK